LDVTQPLIPVTVAAFAVIMGGAFVGAFCLRKSSDQSDHVSFAETNQKESKRNAIQLSRLVTNDLVWVYGGCQNYGTEVEEYESTVVYRTLLFHNSCFLRTLGKNYSQPRTPNFFVVL